MDPFTLAQNRVNSVFNSMGSAIDKFVETGKFSFNDFARSVIQDLIKIQLKAQATQLFKGLMGAAGGGGGLFGGAIIPGFLASGGPATAGKPYVVGEQGPELFVPKSSGTVVPNDKLGGGGTASNTYITNNISALDAKSVAQLFAENRKTLLGTVQLAQKEMPYGNR
jgi:phage-related minor tail protein